VGLRLQCVAPLVVGSALALCPSRTVSQEIPPDSMRADSLFRATLAPMMVTVTRRDVAWRGMSRAVATVRGSLVTEGRSTDALADVLLTVPGVFAVDRYNDSQDERISIRGFGARSAFGLRGVKLVLDGIPQTLPDGQGQLSSIELSDVERIEVLRGASSSLYGNASGGVISVTSRSRPPDRVGGRARVDGGAFAFRKAFAAVEAPLGAGALFASGSWTKQDGFRDHSSAEMRRASVRLHQPLAERTRLSALLYVADSPDALNPGSLTSLEADTLPAQAAPFNVQVGAFKSIRQGQAGVAVDHRLGPDAAVSLAVFGSRRVVDNRLTFGEIDLARWTYGVRASGTWQVAGVPFAPTVTVGVDAQQQRDQRENRSLDGTETTLDQFETVGEIGPFVETAFSLGRGVTLNAGVRYDAVGFRVDDRLLVDGDQSGGRTMHAASGSVGLVAGASDVVTPWVNVSSAFETPTTTELVNRPDGGGGLNPALEPQRTWSYEFGVRGVVAEGLRYEVVAYRADIRSALVPFEDPAQPGRRFFRNAATLRSRGLEVGVDAALPATISVGAAYTLGDHVYVMFRTAADTLDDNDMPGVPQHRLHLFVRAGASRGVWGVLEQTFTSAYYVDDVNSEQVSGFAVSNVRVGWRGVLGRATVDPYVAVLNLFDRMYSASVVVNARGGRFYEPAPGRRLLVGVEARF